MTDEIDDTAATPSPAPQDDKAPAAKADAGAKTEPKADTKVDAPDEEKPGDQKPADDWRVRFAGDDAKELKRLSRYASEADMYKAYRELEKKKSAGELRAPLSKDASPEELTQWRKDNGIPDAPDKYDLKFDDGLVIGEQDKPLIDEFVTKMHGENATPSQVKAAIASYYEIVGKQQQAMAEADVDFKEQSLEGLREEWGGDYKRNLNAIGNLLSELPDDTRSAFETARTADGKLIGNDPAIIKWLAKTAFELNPAAAVMPAAGANAGSSINDEISSIEKLIGNTDSDYWRGQKENNGNTKMQNRYTELLSAKEKISARS